MDVIYNGIYGSHLYGLETPSSDMDYKGVYAPDMKSLIFGKFKDSIEKQTKEVDETYYAVTKFIKILEKNDTVSMDMLYSNKEAAIITTPLWDELQSHRQDLLCKNMRGLFGYIKTQTYKYGHKVQRYDEMCDFLEFVKKEEDAHKIQDTLLPTIVNGWCGKSYKYISYNKEHHNIDSNIDVCGSRYLCSAQVGYLRKGLEAKIAKYGNRTKKGSLQAGDYKSLSHAYRVLVQMEELIDTRDLIFPLIKKDKILQVKLGKLSQDVVVGMIDEMYDIVMEKLDKSDLPEYNDISKMKDAVYNYYGV